MLDLVRRHIVIIVMAIVVLAGLFFMNKDNNAFDVQMETDFEQEIQLVEEENNEELETVVLVDVKGEIEKPGVYEVDSGARITDAISIAGGFTGLADQTQINLAQKVQDEMVIIVPKEGEEFTGNSTVNTAVLHQQEDQVNINYATKEEIETLSGIGSKKAQAIIDYRDENGPFQSVEDLANINGIGEKTVENIKDNIAIR